MGQDISLPYGTAAHYVGRGDPDLPARISRRYDRQVFTADEQKILVKWAVARSCAEILDLNRAYLRGEAEFTPLHMGPLYNETLPLVPGLLRLHDYGLFTLRSQPYREVGPEFTRCGCCPDWAWFHTWKREFLTFVLPNDGYVPISAKNKFVRELMGDPRIFTSVFDGEKGFHNFPENVGCDAQTHVTCKTHSREELDTDKAEIHLETFCVPRDKTYIPAVMVGTGTVFKTKPLQVNVMTRKWEKVDVIGLIEQSAIKAGLERTYAGGIE